MHDARYHVASLQKSARQCLPPDYKSNKKKGRAGGQDYLTQSRRVHSPVLVRLGRERDSLLGTNLYDGNVTSPAMGGPLGFPHSPTEVGHPREGTRQSVCCEPQ
jgi:hypothetical protein